MRLNIIAFASNPWRGPKMNRQHLLAQLARNHDVTYSTGPLLIWSRLGPEWRRTSWLGRYVSVDNVVVDSPPKMLLRWPKYIQLDRLVVWLYGRRLARACAKRSTGPKVMILFDPDFLPYVEQQRPDVIVYHAYDLFECAPDWTAERAALENALLQRADVVSTVTALAQSRLQERSGRAVHVLANGVDLTVFAPERIECSDVPADIAEIPRPRIGFIGNLRPNKVDYPLLTAMATARPDWHFIMVGDKPGAAAAADDPAFGTCCALPNIHFVPRRPHDAIPSYLNAMDVNIMPYRLSPQSWIIAGHPLKLFEYLAVGKPIVTCDLDALREHQGVLRIVTSLATWIEGIEHAIFAGGVGTVASRRQSTAGQGWDRRAQSVDNWIVQALQNSVRPDARK